MAESQNDAEITGLPPPVSGQQNEDSNGAEIQTYETLSGRKPHPEYLAKGPIISKESFDKWTPEMLGIPQNSRPVRSTRNPQPKYVDAVSMPMSSYLGSIAWSASPIEIDAINKAITRQSTHALV